VWGLLLVVSALAVAIAAPAPTSAGSPVAHAAKKCKKKHRKKKCKKKKQQPVAPALPPAVLSISPTSLDYDTPVPGNHVKRTVVLSNVGGSPSGVPAVSISGTNASNYSIGANGCTAALAAAASCQIEVELTSTTLGVKTATLTVTATPGGTVFATMTGQFAN
jgi:hypothetical protein